MADVASWRRAEAAMTAENAAGASTTGMSMRSSGFGQAASDRGGGAPDNHSCASK
jgi:hypothetical protein